MKALLTAEGPALAPGSAEMAQELRRVGRKQELGTTGFSSRNMGPGTEDSTLTSFLISVIMDILEISWSDSPSGCSRKSV